MHVINQIAILNTGKQENTLHVVPAVDCQIGDWGAASVSYSRRSWASSGSSDCDVGLQLLTPVRASG